jgi:hypothetical protein
MISVELVWEIQFNHRTIGIQFYGNWVILVCLDMVNGVGKSMYLLMWHSRDHMSAPRWFYILQKKTSTHDQTLTQNQRQWRRPHTTIDSPKVKPLSERAGATCQKWSYNGAVPAFCVYTA